MNRLQLKVEIATNVDGGSNSTIPDCKPQTLSQANLALNSWSLTETVGNHFSKPHRK